MSPRSEPEMPSGLVAGKYRLIRLLGQGGMGTVWEGQHAELHTRVAVKFIDSEYASSDDVRQRFVNEAKAAARLRSKHVVQVYDQGVADDGRPYIVMEFLSGEALDGRLDRLGTLAPEETARMVLHVSRALARAHEGGIVHRDLKPENIFLVHDDEDHTDIAKVVDFGIAKFTDPSGTGSSSTRTGAVLGTPQYMSPEQARGLRSVDHRTDLWSLGVIVYRCLVGAMPFKGEAVGDLLVNVCTAEVPAPSSVMPGVPPGFDAWVRRALAREPSERFQSAGELCDSLAVVCGVDARLGPTSQATRVEWSAPAAGREGRAVTEGPFATSAPREPRSRGPFLAMLGGLFVVLTAASVFGARVLFGVSEEPSGAAAAPAPTGSAAASGSLGPAVSPVVPSASPSAASASVGAAEAPVSVKARARPGARPAAKPEKPAAAPAAPPPARPPKKPDLLGY